MGCVITFRDITERARYEEKMMFNHLVLENAGPMMWLDPATRTCVYANPAACEHLGYGKDELVGMRVPQWDPSYLQDDDANVREIADRVAKGGSVSFASRHRRSQRRDWA